MNDDALARSFSKYSSFLKAKVIRDKYTKKTKGFGFVSFKTPQDFMQAMKEMNGNYKLYFISSWGGGGGGGGGGAFCISEEGVIHLFRHILPA